MVDVDSENIYFYGNDKLGTPQILTDSTNTVVWEAVYKPFGEAEINPNSITENNFRFAGQYFDSETGFHYNYLRYYDPSTGRYLRPDPIKIRGGDINFYTYVRNNPINFIDITGLEIKKSYLILPGTLNPQQHKKQYKVINDLSTAQKLASITEAGLTGSTLKTALQAIESEFNPVGTGDIMQAYATMLDYVHAKFSAGWVVYTKINYEDCEYKYFIWGKSCTNKTSGWVECKESSLFLLGHFAYQNYAEALRDVKKCMEENFSSFVDSLNK